MATSSNDTIDVPYRADANRSPQTGENPPDSNLEAASVEHHQAPPPKPGSSSLARLTAVVSIVFGAAVFIGWWLNLQNLQSLWPSRISIPPNGGLIAVLLGIGLASNIGRSLGAVHRFVGVTAAVVATGLGVICLCQYIFQWNSRIDLWIFKDRLLENRDPFPGRLSFPGALSAVCLGLGIALLDLRIKGIWLSQLLAVIAALIALLALVGYVCGVPEFYGQLSGQKSGCHRKRCLACFCSAPAC